jgi:hypothetical protein
MLTRFFGAQDRRTPSSSSLDSLVGTYTLSFFEIHSNIDLISLSRLTESCYHLCNRNLQGSYMDSEVSNVTEVSWFSSALPHLTNTSELIIYYLQSFDSVQSE